MRLPARPLIRPSGTFSREGEKGGSKRHALDEQKRLSSSMSTFEPEVAFYMHFNIVDVVCVD